MLVMEMLIHLFLYLLETGGDREVTDDDDSDEAGPVFM